MSGVVDRKFVEKYGKGGTVGDELSEALGSFLKDEKGKKLDPDRIIEVAEANDIDHAKWDHLNIGMKSMSLRNTLRGKIRIGENVKVGRKVIKGDPAGKERAKEKDAKKKAQLEALKKKQAAKKKEEAAGKAAGKRAAAKGGVEK